MEREKSMQMRRKHEKKKQENEHFDNKFKIYCIFVEPFDCYRTKNIDIMTILDVICETSIASERGCAELKLNKKEKL